MIKKTTKNRVTKISRKKFPVRYDPERTQENVRALMGLLLEEGGELAGAIRTYYGRQYRPELKTGNIESVMGEVGDILVVLNGVCDLFGITMDQCLNMAAEKLERRYEQEQVHRLTLLSHHSQPDAVPTPDGWNDPATGKALVRA